MKKNSGAILMQVIFLSVVMAVLCVQLSRMFMIQSSSFSVGKQREQMMEVLESFSLTVLRAYELGEQNRAEQAANPTVVPPLPNCPTGTTESNPTTTARFCFPTTTSGDIVINHNGQNYILTLSLVHIVGQHSPQIDIELKKEQSLIEKTKFAFEQFGHDLSSWTLLKLKSAVNAIALADPYRQRPPALPASAVDINFFVPDCAGGAAPCRVCGTTAPDGICVRLLVCAPGATCATTNVGSYFAQYILLQRN